MNLIIDGMGAVVAASTEPLEAALGQSAVIVADDKAVLAAWAAVGADEALTYDPKAQTFSKTARAIGSDEQTRRDRLATLTQAIGNWDTLTVAQRNAVLKVVLQFVVKLATG